MKRTTYCDFVANGFFLGVDSCQNPLYCFARPPNSPVLTTQLVDFVNYLVLDATADMPNEV